MASDLGFVKYIVEQIDNAGEITFIMMFGEYGLYSDGTIMAVVCDDKLFVKPTEAGRSFIKDVIEAPPYQGAKSYFLIEDQIEDREWISELVRVTVAELLETKPRAKKRRN